jgi:hypothetical protein
LPDEGIRRPVPDRRDPCRQQLREVAAMVIQHAEHLLQPWLALLEGGNTAEHAQVGVGLDDTRRLPREA